MQINVNVRVILKKAGIYSNVIVKLQINAFHIDEVLLVMEAQIKRF